ncbi:MAG: SMI1/KNR4 family protein [Bacteroidetes bacterium]|nr:SMI1/KNR4 family protein [Bacteroidota bacterium]
MNYLGTLIQQLRKKGIQPSSLVGCSVDEINFIEKSIQAPLPQVFKEFLQIMGKGAGDFLLGSSCFFNELINLNSWAQELLEENDFEKKLPSYAFVFWMHQGYQFAFFHLNTDEDPEVYFYYEGRTRSEFEKCNLKVSEFYIEKCSLM